MASDPGVAPEQIEAIVDLAYRRLDALAKRITAIGRETEHREDRAGVVLLLQTLTLLCAQARRRVDSEYRETADDPGLATEHLRMIRRTIEAAELAVGQMLDPLSRPPERHLEPLIEPYVRLAKEVTGHRETALIFAASESYVYQVLPDAFSTVKKQLRTITRSFSGNPELRAAMSHLPLLAVITYPVRADSDTFQHAVIAHEVSHLVLAQDAGQGPSLRDEAFNAALQKAGLPRQVQGPPNAEVGEAKSSGAIAEAPHGANEGQAAGRLGPGEANRLKLWLDELASDHLAVQLIGPAYFFSLVEYVLPTREPKYDPSGREYESHPPIVWRLELLAKEVETFLDQASKETEELKQVRELFDRYQQLVALHKDLATKPEETREVEDQEREFLLEALAEVERRAPELLPTAADATTFANEMNLVWRKLQRGIAPAERILGRTGSAGKLKARLEGLISQLGGQGNPAESEDHHWSEPINWQSILNGCYFDHLRRVWLEKEQSADRDADNQMARGAIELSELHRRMRELHGEFHELNPPE